MVGRFSAGGLGRWGGPKAGFDPGACRLELRVLGAVRIERIDPGRHDRSVFDCGDSAVDGWLRQDAIVADRQQGVVVQVASDGRRVVGCYRLGSFQVQARRPVRSLGSFDLDRMPVPALMVSHLCVDQRLQGRGLGAQLMLLRWSLPPRWHPPLEPGS